MDLHELGAVDLAQAVRKREVSAREVAEHTLRRAEAASSQLGAFTVLAPDLALAQADEIDRQLARGAAPDAQQAPFLGVPCPIKDLTPVAGLPYQRGSIAHLGEVAEVDDDIVGWLRAAGTLMVGKTNTPEFGLPCYTEPDPAIAPPARTPYDPSRTAGGSSGGAAVAVASQIVPIAHGSDGGGSIRIPASCCGLVGLKASRGRVPNGMNLPGPAFTTDGVLTRTVKDTQAAFAVLSRQRGRGDTIQGSQTRSLARPRRVGVLTQPIIAEAPVHPDCLDAVTITAIRLEELGCEVTDAPVPFPVEQWDAFAALWAVGALAEPLTPAQEEQIRPLTRWLRDEGRKYSGLELMQAWGAAQQTARDVHTAWESFDVILTPTLAQPPVQPEALRDDTDPAADFAAQTRFTPWTSLYNLCGLPAISLPLHTTRIDGVTLPIGVMLGAHWGADELLLGIAACLEEEFSNE
ncbi:MAG: amidase [Propionibacteriaceae bacterium]|jgi:amidase|nr:amidase [Propionibacteriaceae bacterium]